MERNNHVLSAAEGNELVATHSLRSVHAWGNLANRMLSFAYKRFDGRVPEPGAWTTSTGSLLARVEAGFDTACPTPPRSSTSTWGTRGSCGAVAPGTQQVVEYREETRSHLALT